MKRLGFSVVPGRYACNPSISCESRCLLSIISSHYSEDGGAWPSLATLGDYLGRSRSTVLRCLNELENLGLIRRVHRYQDGQQKSTRYELLFDRWSTQEPTSDTLQGVTGDSLEGVTDETPRGIARDALTIPLNKKTKPPIPLLGGKKTAFEDKRQAKNRSERKLLDTYSSACDPKLLCLVCQNELGLPWIVENPNGTIGVSIYPVDIQEVPFRGRVIVSAVHFHCKDNYFGSSPA